MNRDISKIKSPVVNGKTSKPVSVRPGSRRRIEWTFYILLAPLGVLAARLIQLQAVDARDNSNNGLKAATMTRTQILPARRADILATDGTALAVTLDEYTVTANPRAISDDNKIKLIAILTKTIGGSEIEYSKLLNKTTRADGKPNFYVRLARRISEDKIDKLRALMKPPKDEHRKARALRKAFWEPIKLEASPRRAYPLGNFASQLIGFTNGAGRGVDGLEWAWNDELAGENGEIRSIVDARSRPIPGQVEKWRAPVAGQTVVTTIDAEIQAATDAAMQQIVEKFRPVNAIAVVMKPKTGEIVAMSTAPSYDLNNRPDNVGDLATNKTLNYAYEPGSTFKVVTAAAAIEHAANWQNTRFTCNGIGLVGKRNMRCWINSTSKRAHGHENLSEGIRDSCNFVMIGFARQVGAARMREYARKFGFGEAIDLGGMRGHPGLIHKRPESWGLAQQANFSFGQGMLVTPLQIARMAATVANDGVMMKPMIIKEVRSETGRVLERFEPQIDRRVVRPETAKILRSMLERVTSEGTASKFIFVPGYQTAGKTGSAQKADGPRGYAAGKFISSFVGFYPSRDPEYVVSILADEPKSSHWGSEVCGPAFAEIAKRSMLHLRLTEGANAPAPQAAFMMPPVKKKN